MSIGTFAKKAGKATPGARSGLQIGPPDDSFEREADRAASEVMSGDTLHWSLSSMGGGTPLRRKCSCSGSGDCEECKTKTVQRKPSDANAPTVIPPVVQETVGSSGRPLDREARSFFETRYKHDFGQVRVHDDPQAARSASAVGALAYTIGHHLVFSAGSYAPQTSHGRSLLAHELAHVVQQGGGGSTAGILPPGHEAETEADRAARSMANAGTPDISLRLSPNQLARQKNPGAGTPSQGVNAAPGSGTPPGATGGPKTPPQRLRFDILGADAALSDFLSKEAALSRDPDLRVTSLEDLISKLEAQAGPNTGRCVEHITVFNHANPYGQPVFGEGGKKVVDAGGAKLPRSGFYLGWLFNPANQTAVARLRSVFCCGAEMHWVGCSTAGIIAYGGKRSKEEVAASQERFGDEFFRNEYRNVEDALAHGATLQGAIFGPVNVQTWADATCTSIRAANEFVIHDVRNTAHPFKPMELKIGDKDYKGEFLLIKPTAAGQCSCDSSTGHVQGQWKPGQGVEVGDPKWQADLQQFNQAIKSSGGAGSTQIDKYLLALVADVAPSLSIPAGLPVGPKAEPYIVAPTVISYTYEHLPFCFPTDCWKWIGVSKYIVQGTPAYTRTNLNHELLHAADFHAAARRYQQAKGPPPMPPPNACEPAYRPSGSDPFGKYILGFHDFYFGGLPAVRHLEIYAQSATKDFQHFTPAEKLDWFESMCAQVPADIPPGQQLPTEALVNGIFQNPVASEQELRVELGTALFSMARGFIYGTDPAPQKEKNPGKARTLIEHFGPAWNAYRPGDRRTLSDAIRLEGGKP